MNMIEPLPVFTPPGAAIQIDVSATPPRIRAVEVHGLRGISDEDNHPRLPSHWMPPDSSTISLPFSPSRIMDNEAPEDTLEIEAINLLEKLQQECLLGNSYIISAEDIGGAIVKLALGIAGQEAKYEHVLNSVQAVVFWGTPHRGSSTCSLDSTIHTIIEACYNGLTGNWLPAKINKISRRLEAIHHGFSCVSHRFTIISYYQRPSPSNSFEVVVTKECATLGLENEITIGCSRPHKDMIRLMNRKEESVLQTHIINSNVGHWSRFKHCMDLLQCVYPNHDLGRPVLSRSHSIMAINTRASDSKLESWVSSEASPRYMTIKLADQADPIEVLNLIARTMWSCPDTLWLACPSINSHGSGEGLQDESWVYASLLQQILTQQPRAFLHMNHLVLLLADAIGGGVASWTERALWLCLRTVLHAPIESPLYGFLHVKKSSDADAVRRIDSELQGTDCTFRLVLAFTDNLPVELKNVDCLDLGFDSLHFEECYPASSRLKSETTSIIADGQNRSSVPDLAWLVQHQGPVEDLASQLLTIRIQGLSRPTYIALVWIAFSRRPLYANEIDLLLDFDRTANSAPVSTGANRQNNLITHLLNVLPDIIFTKQRRVFLSVSYDMLRKVLHRLSENYFPPALTPHLYIAQSCLTVLTSYPLKTTDYCTLETTPDCNHASNNPLASICDMGGVDQENSEKANCDPMNLTEAGVHDLPDPRPPSKRKCNSRSFDEITTSHRTLADYTARNWLTHYELSRMGDEPESNDEAYCAFVSDVANIQNWLYLVEHFTDWSQKASGRFTSNSFDLLQRYLDITKLESLKTLYRLASRQSSFPALGCLLIDAVEFGNETVVHSLLAEVDALPEECILRALATTHGGAHDDMRRRCTDFLQRQHPRRLAQVQLTAQVLGNESTSRQLSEELLGMPVSSERDGWYEDALHRAIEHSDDAVIDFLKNHSLQRDLKSRQGAKWSLIHRAASQGNLLSLTRLWEAGFKEDVNVFSPDHRSPLFIASSYGFSEITRFLALNGAHVNITNGTLKETALHVASEHGHWKTTNILLDHLADTTIADAAGNFALHHAICKAHVRLAMVLIEHFPNPPATLPAKSYSSAAIPHSDTVSSGEFEGSDIPVANSSLTVEHTSRQGLSRSELAGYSLLDRANTQGRTVLFVAAAMEFPTIGRRLLERGADPNILADCSRVTLHMASKAGSIDLIQQLLDTGAVTHHQMDDSLIIPLHYACYWGHVEAAKVLAGYGHRDSRDSFNHTPFSAACAGGHIHVVRVLTEYYNKETQLEGLIAAVRSGHRDVVIYLLGMGCHIDAKTTDGETALSVAASSGNARITQILLQRGAKLANIDSKGDSALHIAADLGFSEIAKLLIEAGAELDTENDAGESPLGLAIYWEHQSVVRLLLESGAKMRTPARFSRYTANLLDFSFVLSSGPITDILLNSYREGNNEDGLTPAKALVTAMKKGRRELLQRILKIWVVPGNEAESESMAEAIHYAVSQGLKDDLEVILRNPVVKASIDHQIPGKGTPLHAAIDATINSGDIVEVLLENGANAEISAGIFGTPLNTACAKANSDIAEKLLLKLPKYSEHCLTGKYGTPIQSTIVGFAKEPNERTIKMLCLLHKHGYRPDNQRQCGSYGLGLHAAAHVSTWEVIHWYMKWDPESVFLIDNAGRPAWHLALLRGDWGIAKAMMEEVFQKLNPVPRHLSILIGLKDFQGLNGLHYAAISSSETTVTTILLEERNSDRRLSLINGKDIDGWTPLHWACRQPRKEILDALIANGADTKALTDESWTPLQIAKFHGIIDAEYLSILPEIENYGEEPPEGVEPGIAEVSCDVCFTPLGWKYYHCQDQDCVGGFNLCFKCYKHAKGVHNKKHGFICINGAMEK
ncbi:ankyrin repeat-containing domain protein [Xylaria cf. heliscus]|nr:ankyrin repeat-containing domain protein [Xylaria cf. heliscus]